MAFYYPNVGSTVEVGELGSLNKGVLIVGDGAGSPTTLNPGTDTYVLTSNSGTATGLEWSAAGSAGEANTASNQGVDGVGVFARKTDVDLEFKNINAGSTKITVTDDTANDEIDIDVDPAEISHDDLADVGTNTHAQIDTHIANTSNPHSVTKTQVGLANVSNDAQLKIASNLSDLNDASTARTNLGVAIGSDVQGYDADLAAVAGLSSTGLIARTGAGTAAVRTLTAPAAGITVSNGDGVSGNPTLALANDLSALEGLSSTGYAVRTAANTWAQRTLTGTSNQISITNGDGTSGNPVFSTPQNIHTAATPQFARMGLGAAADGTAELNLSTGSVKVGGSNPKSTIVLTAAGGWSSTTSGAASVTKVEYTTNDQDLQLMDFDASTEEYAQWTIVMPDSYDGSTITAVFYWTAASGSGNVIWGLQGRSYADDEAIDQAWGTAQTVTDTLIATGDVHVTSATGAITLAGTPAGGELVQFRVYRDADNGSDTFSADARLIAVKIEFGVNNFSD